MIRPFLDSWFSLSILHRLVVVVTIIVPVVFPACLRYVSVESLWLRIVLDLAAVLFWVCAVVIVVALLVRRDSAAARQLVESQVDPLEDEVRGVREEHRRAIRDVRADFLDLERRTRLAVEDLGGSLLLRDVSLSMSASAGEPTAAFDLPESRTPPLGLRARLMWWFGRARRAVWRAIRRVIWDFRQDRD